MFYIMVNLDSAGATVIYFSSFVLDTGQLLLITSEYEVISQIEQLPPGVLV